jgi:hypothetical protein
MRLFVPCLPIAIAAAFMLGRATSPDDASATMAARHVYTGRQGDVFRVPAAATRCVVSREEGFLTCFARGFPQADSPSRSSRTVSSSGATEIPIGPRSPRDGSPEQSSKRVSHQRFAHEPLEVRDEPF